MHLKSIHNIALSLLAVVAAAAMLIPACAEDPVDPPPPPKPLPIPTNGLLAFYPFNGDALDASGNNNHATIRGGATVPNFLTIGDNTLDYVLLPHRILDGVGDFSISAWARINTLHATGINTMVSGARAGCDNVVLLHFTAGDNMWDCGLNCVGYSFGPDETIRDQGWHHVVMIRSGTVGCVYLDNQQVGDSLTVTAGTLTIASGGLLLGQEQDAVGGDFQAGQSWAGDIDNLRFYNRALNATEIRALFQETGWGD